MTENEKLANNLKIVYNLLAQSVLPPTPVGKVQEVHQVVENFRVIIDLIDKGGLVVTVPGTQPDTSSSPASVLDFTFDDEEVLNDASE